MQAWRFEEFGDISNFKLGDWPEPKAAPDEVLIRVNFVSLNPADRLLVEGKYPGAGELPLTVGRDASGVVEQAPTDSNLVPGDEVVVLRSEVGVTRQGTLAERVTVPERSVARLPQGWSLEDGAAAPLVYLTAWKALVTQGGLQEGEAVLVTGASGGVGVAAVQLAKALGAKVVALSRDEAKRVALEGVGADAAVDTSAEDAEDQIRAALGGNADIIVDNLAGAYLQRHINLANLNGRIMVIGLLAGRQAEIELGMVLFKQVRIEGVHVGKFAPPEAQSAWAKVVETLDRVNKRPLIDKVFAMGEVQEAFAHLAGGHLGKVLVNVASDAPN